MNTVLTEEERALQMIYKEYADERIRPHTLEIDKGLFSVEPLLKEMHELGFCGIVIPKEYGGLGSSYVHYVLAVEELSKASGPVAKSVSGQTNMCFPILHYGTEEQKQKYVVPWVKGEKRSAFTLTEPGAGEQRNDIAVEYLRKAYKRLCRLIKVDIQRLTGAGHDNVGLFDTDAEIIAHIFDRRAVALDKTAGENGGYFHLVIENAVYAEVNAEQLCRFDHIVAHGVSVDLANGRVGVKYPLGAVVYADRLLA